MIKDILYESYHYLKHTEIKLAPDEYWKIRCYVYYDHYMINKMKPQTIITWKEYYLWLDLMFEDHYPQVFDLREDVKFDDIKHLVKEGDIVYSDIFCKKYGNDPDYRDSSVCVIKNNTINEPCIEDGYYTPKPKVITDFPVNYYGDKVGHHFMIPRESIIEIGCPYTMIFIKEISFESSFHGKIKFNINTFNYNNIKFIWIEVLGIDEYCTKYKLPEAITFNHIKLNYQCEGMQCLADIYNFILNHIEKYNIHINIIMMDSFISL
jgi:hypothetical protein